MKSDFENVYNRALAQPDAGVDALLDRVALVSYNGYASRMFQQHGFALLNTCVA